MNFVTIDSTLIPIETRYSKHTCTSHLLVVFFLRFSSSAACCANNTDSVMIVANEATMTTAKRNSGKGPKWIPFFRCSSYEYAKAAEELPFFMVPSKPVPLGKVEHLS